MVIQLDRAMTVPVRDTELAYQEVGEGEPVVLVHGTLSDMRTWEHQMPALGRSYRTIAYSRRWSPPNPLIPPDFDDQMAPHVEDLSALLEALDAAPAHLVGDSWGGFVVLLCAIQRPELVRSLVLQEPPVLTLFTGPKPGPAGLLPLLFRRPRTALAILRFGLGTLAPVERALKRDEDERAVERFAEGVLGTEIYKQTSAERRQQALDNAGTMRAQVLGAGFPPLDDDDVRSVAVPVLLVNGELSPPFFWRLSDRLEELLPHTRRVAINGASHGMHEQQPDLVNEALLAFLAQVRGRADVQPGA